MNFDPSRLTELALQHAQLKPIYQAESSNPYAALQSFSGNAIEALRDNAKSVRSVTPLQDVLAYTQREYNDLCELIESEIFQHMPKNQQSLILRQRLVMIDYLAVLNERIAAFTV